MKHVNTIRTMKTNAKIIKTINTIKTNTKTLETKQTPSRTLSKPLKA